jgi:hypothetical protein
MFRPETLPSGVRILYADEHHVIGMLQDLQLSFSKSEPTTEFLNASLRLAKEEATKLAGGMGLLAVIDARAPPPGSAAKDQLKRMYPEVSALVRVLARVVEGDGFLASAKRGALSIIDMAMRLKCPSKVFGRTEEAVAWMLQQMGPSEKRRYTGGDVVRAIRELRAYHEQPLR